MSVALEIDVSQQTNVSLSGTPGVGMDNRRPGVLQLMGTPKSWTQLSD